jgi:hypothetical protein
MQILHNNLVDRKTGRALIHTEIRKKKKVNNLIIYNADLWQSLRKRQSFTRTFTEYSVL